MYKQYMKKYSRLHPPPIPYLDALSREINTIDFSMWPGADGLNTAYSNIIQIPPSKGTARMRQPADKLVGNSYQCACTILRGIDSISKM